MKKRQEKRQEKKEQKGASQIAVLVAVILTIITATPVSANIPFACFADGEVFNNDGSTVEAGVKVEVKNLRTNETRNTTTGYPNYPPVDMYDNDYKTVFTCVSGQDFVSVRATNGTHYGYEEIKIPEDSQAILDITIDKKLEEEKEKKTILKRIMEKTGFERLFKYFMGS